MLEFNDALPWDLTVPTNTYDNCSLHSTLCTLKHSFGGSRLSGAGLLGLWKTQQEEDRKAVLIPLALETKEQHWTFAKEYNHPFCH